MPIYKEPQRASATMRPILFSTEMVKAILEGRKTQTRRVVKPQPDPDGLHNHTKFPMSIDSRYDLEGWCGTVDNTGETKQFRCPYGEEWDLLWVREAWAYQTYWNGLRVESLPIYKASYGPEPTAWNWKPSIHMHKSVARIWLQIEEIKVERVQAINEENSISEGITFDKDSGYFYAGSHAMGQSAYACFRNLWKSINGPDSWDANPWIWVIKFKVVSTNGLNGH